MADRAKIALAQAIKGRAIKFGLAAHKGDRDAFVLYYMIEIAGALIVAVLAGRLKEVAPLHHQHAAAALGKAQGHRASARTAADHDNIP